MKAFEKVMKRLEEKNNRPVHTVVRYNYTMEESREQMLSMAQTEKVLSFEKIFDACNERIQAIFTFLSLLELVQQKYLTIMIGEGKNNFIIEFNENREEEQTRRLRYTLINPAGYLRTPGPSSFRALFLQCLLHRSHILFVILSENHVQLSCRGYRVF